MAGVDHDRLARLARRLGRHRGGGLGGRQWVFAVDPDTQLIQAIVGLVTGNDWKPFTDESLPGGGIYVQMTVTALNRAGNASAGSELAGSAMSRHPECSQHPWW